MRKLTTFIAACACLSTTLHAELPASSAPSQADELIFIDSASPEVPRLLAGVRPGVEAVVISAEQDFLAEVGAAMSRRTGIRAVHIVSHAAPGELRLGSTVVDVNELEKRSATIGSWHQGMTHDGVVAFYGCELAASGRGQRWIHEFSRLAAVNVAASTNLTGASALGGDWVLESRVGKGVAQSPFVHELDYPAVLPAPRLEPGYQFALYVRPGGTSYIWRFGLHNDSVVNPGLSPTVGAAYFNVPDPGFGWFLERGKFQTSTNGGVNWTDYTVNNSSNPIYISNAANTYWRFVDNNASDTTTVDQIGHAINLQNGGNVGGSGTFINPDNAPTGITFGGIGIFTDTLAGGTVMSLSVTDTGMSVDGRWVLESLSVPNLLTISHDPSAGNTASLLLGSGTMPAVGATVNVGVRYHDVYQTDNSGNPIGGTGVAATAALTVVEDAFTSLVGMTGETAANTFTVGAQNAPGTALLSTGNYVVVWRSVAQGSDTGTNGGIYARVFNSSAVAQTAELRISPLDNVNQLAPAVAALSGGRFVVAYTDVSNANDIIFTIVSAAGVTGSYVTAHTVTTGAQSAARLAALPNGNFALVWVNPNNGNDISARVFSGTDGSAVGTEFTVNTTTAGAQNQPDVAAIGASGDFAVVWRDAANAGDILARRANASGTIGSEISVVATATNQNAPRVTGFSDGRFVVCYTDPGLDGDGTTETNMYFRRYAADGTPAAAAARANSNILGNQTAPSITTLGNGNFLLSWTSTIQDYEGTGIFARRFQADGTAVDTTDFQVNQRRHFNQNQIAVAPLGTAGFAAAWSDSAQEGASNSGVETRTFVPAAGDTTAPAFDVAPATASITTSGFNLSASIDEGGTIFYVVVANAATAPTSAQVVAGQNGSGAAALASGSQAVASTPFSHTFTVSGLSAGTAYDLYVVARDDESTPNLQASPVKVDVSTTAATPTVATPTSANVLSTSATLGGTITADGGAALTERGIVYALTSANTNPQINGSGVTKVPASGTATGTFTTPVTGLTASSAYTYAAYATNSSGTSYSPTAAFTTSAPPDTTPPTVTSIVRRLPSTAQATTSTSATFRVTFSEPVNAPATSNFAVVPVNSSSIVGTITSVTPVSSSIYDVAVTITSGTGEFRLKIID